MSLFDDIDLGAVDPNPISTQPTSRFQSRPTRASILTTESKAQSTLKIPRWGWFIIIGLSLVIVVAAILIPLFLIKSKSAVPGTPTPTGPAGSPPLAFPNVPVEAVEFQNLVPPLDGLVKGDIQITQASVDAAGFIVVGTNSKSAFYVTDLATGDIDPPDVLVNTNVFSTWCNAYGQQITYSEQFPTADIWYSCVSQVATKTAPCSVISWPQEDLLDHDFFSTTLWSNVSNNIIFSFATNAQGDYEITAQDSINVYTDMQVVVPGLSAPLKSSIINMFYSFNQQYVTFGFTETFSNTIFYITHFDTKSRPLQKIVIDVSGETLLYAAVTNDALWLLVLTSARLIIYGRNIDAGNLDFHISDAIVLDLMDSNPSTCAIDRTYDETSTNSSDVWCSLGTTENETVIIPFNSSTGLFVDASAWSVPTKVMETTSGPLSVQRMLDLKTLYFVSSDAAGNYENAAVDLNKL
jgi:hypothetical protein